MSPLSKAVDANENYSISKIVLSLWYARGLQYVLQVFIKITLNILDFYMCLYLSDISTSTS